MVLLDYLIKCGSERVAQQCKENIFSVETLKVFYFIFRVFGCFKIYLFLSPCPYISIFKSQEECYVFFRSRRFYVRISFGFITKIVGTLGNLVFYLPNFHFLKFLTRPSLLSSRICFNQEIFLILQINVVLFFIFIFAHFIKNIFRIFNTLKKIVIRD